MVWEASHVSGISGQLKKHHAEHVHPTQPINLNRHKGYDLFSISDHLTVTVRGFWELRTKPSIGHWVKRRACPCQSFLSTCTVWCMLMQTVLCFGFAYPCPSRNFNPGLMNEKLVRYWYGVDLAFISICVKRTLHGVPVLWRVSSRDPGLPHHQKRAHQVNIPVSALDQGTGLCWLCITPPRCWEPLSPHDILYAID